jgi:integrase
MLTNCATPSSEIALRDSRGTQSFPERPLEVPSPNRLQRCSNQLTAFMPSSDALPTRDVVILSEASAMPDTPNMMTVADVVRRLVADRKLDGRRRHVMSSSLRSLCRAMGADPNQVPAEPRYLSLKLAELTPADAGVSRDRWASIKSLVRAALRHVGFAVPSHRRHFSLPLAVCPPSHQADIGRFLNRGSNPDVFSDHYCRPLAALTIRNQRRYILMATTALVWTGFPLSSITGLDVLAEPQNAKALLRFLCARARRKSTVQTYYIASILKVIARHHLRWSKSRVKQLRDLCKALAPKHRGFGDNNRRALRQFSTKSKLLALFTLADRILADLKHRETLRWRDAVRVERAIAIAFLLDFPIRADNLTGLHRERHFKRVGKRTLVAIPANETKNHLALEAELSPDLIRRLRIYRKRYRPLLIKNRSPWLFPGRAGARRSTCRFGHHLSEFLHEEIGVIMTPHQFRHLAAKIYLDRHPGDFETVRRLLGHKSLQITKKFYCELDSVLASKRYVEIVDKLVTEEQRRIAHPRRKKDA